MIDMKMSGDGGIPVGAVAVAEIAGVDSGSIFRQCPLLRLQSTRVVYESQVKSSLIINFAAKVAE